MRGGQNRVPAALKLVRGTFRKDRERAPVSALDGCKVPPPPKALPENERALWLDLARQVEATKAFTHADVSSFRLLVKLAAMVEGDTTGMAPTALVGLIQAYAGHLQRFGLDPASHNRVSAARETAAEDEDPTAEFRHG